MRARAIELTPPRYFDIKKHRMASKLDFRNQEGMVGYHEQAVSDRSFAIFLRAGCTPSRIQRAPVMQCGHSRHRRRHHACVSGTQRRSYSKRTADMIKSSHVRCPRFFDPPDDSDNTLKFNA
jgi:hypothetical protein